MLQTLMASIITQQDSKEAVKRENKNKHITGDDPEVISARVIGSLQVIELDSELLTEPAAHPPSVLTEQAAHPPSVLTEQAAYPPCVD